LPFLLFLLLFCVPAIEAAAPPFRGVWVVRHSVASAEEASETARRAHEAGFNALFVQVRGRGDAYYRSRFAPPGEDVDEGFDPLEAVVKAAHQQGLQVHAWFNVYLAWYRPGRPPRSPDHVFRARPDWFMTSRDGLDLGDPDVSEAVLQDRSVDGRYLSPSLPEVRDHILDLVGELVGRYELDGLHLDYVRYPNRHYDYRQTARDEFEGIHGTDPGDSVGRPGDAQVGKASGISPPPEAWNVWRAEQVSLLVSRIRTVSSRVRPGLKVSAAVKPDPEEAYTEYGQDWPRWLREGWIDFAVPMIYTGTVEDVYRQMRQIRREVREGTIYAGIGAWNRESAEVVEQARNAVRAGYKGMVVFSYESLIDRPELPAMLRSGPFSQKESRVKAKSR
jgi:uncharacterized lipoprotein YddW (UPF0748 family)